MLSVVFVRFNEVSYEFDNFLKFFDDEKFFMKTCEAMDIPIKKQRMRYTEDEKRCLVVVNISQTQNKIS